MGYFAMPSHLTRTALRAAAAVLAVLVVLAMSGPAPQAAAAEGEQLGLHVSRSELAVWRTRAAEGPYRVADDAIPNSPGDWARIVEQRDRFLADPAHYVWPGPTHDHPNPIINSSSWPRDLTGMPGTGHHRGAPEPIRDAAFHAMVLGADQVPGATMPPGERDAVLRQVKDAILTMVRSPHADFGDRQRFNTTTFGTGFHPSFQLSAWITKLVFAYDYSQVANAAIWSPAERAEFITWLDQAADWFIANVEKRRDGMFAADGSVTAAGDAAFASGQPIWSGGPESEKVHHRMDNHVPRLVRVPLWAGLLAELEQTRTGTSVLSAERIDHLVGYGHRQVHDYLVAEFIPQAPGAGGGVASAGGNFYRGVTDTGPLDGWKYAMEHLGSTLVIADHIARAGDPAIYETATTMGTSLSAGSMPDDGVTDGGPKTLRGAIRQLLRYIDEDGGVVRYGCLGCSGPDWRIDSRDEVNGIDRANEWEVLHANVYFQDDYVRSIYLRSRPGTPPLPTNPRSGQGWITGGDHGTYPGVNFMFAQTEGLVWPYAGADAPSPAPPAQPSGPTHYQRPDG